jgi:hypothetical protein
MASEYTHLARSHGMYTHMHLARSRPYDSGKYLVSYNPDGFAESAAAVAPAAACSLSLAWASA